MTCFETSLILNLHHHLSLLQLVLLHREVQHFTNIAIGLRITRAVFLALLQVLAQPEVLELLQFAFDVLQIGGFRRLLSLSSHENVVQFLGLARRRHLVLESNHLLAGSLRLLSGDADCEGQHARRHGGVARR